MATYFVAMDVHAAFTQIVALSPRGQVVFGARCDTTIPELVAVLDEIDGRKKLTFEEGPLAGWLYRNLRGRVDEVIVCEPFIWTRTEFSGSGRTAEGSAVLTRSPDRSPATFPTPRNRSA